MHNLLRFPHGLLRRHLATVERLLVALGLAAILFGLMRGLPAYPPYWDVVICALVFGLTLWSPMAGYLLAALAAAFPIYSLSLYLAVLFLAVALLGIRPFANNLGATILVLITPWLAPYSLFWVTPLLGGLWWGAAGGAVIGGLAALWGQLLAGMSGQSPDWLARLGLFPDIPAFITNFRSADSLQTLLRIFTPLTPDSTWLLHFLLQVILWALVGGLLGALVEKPRLQNRRPWASILLCWMGAAMLPAGHFIPALWFGLYDQEKLAGVIGPALIGAALSALLVSILEAVQDLLEHPLPTARSHRRAGSLAASRPSRTLPRAARPASPAGNTTVGNSPAAAASPPVNPAASPNAAEESDADDLIMLELD